MKRQYSMVFAIVLLLSASASAQDRAILFGNVRLGETPTNVAEAMSKVSLMPFAEVIIDPRFPLDQAFEGMLLGSKALVITAYDASGSLEKVSVSFLTLDKDCLNFYKQFKAALDQKYGATIVAVEHYDYPYNNGGHGGHEEAAIHLGKGHLASVWNWQDADVKGGGISLSVTDNLTVRLTYESAKWASEADRRQTLVSSIF